MDFDQRLADMEREEEKRLFREKNKSLLAEMDDYTRHIYDTYTHVQKPPSDIRVGLKVGVQCFYGDDLDSVEHAEWRRIMLAKALANLVKMERI